jgi:chloramphenicol-sensitive protein RarD
VAHGKPPVIALVLAVSFGLYGLIKNRVGADVGALTSLTTETIVLALPAAAVLTWLESTGRGHFTDDPPWQGILLPRPGSPRWSRCCSSPRPRGRVPLSTLGLLQYLTPTLQLLCGVLLLGEHMAPARWAGFALVWVALVVLTVDTLRRRHAGAWPPGRPNRSPPDLASSRRPRRPCRPVVIAAERSGRIDPSTPTPPRAAPLLHGGDHRTLGRGAA